MMNIYVANLAKYNEGELVGEWISLPADNLEEQIQAILGDDEEYAIHDYECEFLKIDEYDNPYELNELAEKLDSLDSHEEEKLKALLEWGYYSDTKEAIENLDNFNLHTDIKDKSDLGYYWIYESGCYDLKNMGNLANYIDHEAFGRDIAMETEGEFTSFGWIEKA
jgi:antirestriction protein